MRNVTFVLLLIALALGAAVIVQHSRFGARLDTTRTAAVRFSNEWQIARSKLDERDRVMAAIETNLNARTEDLVKATTQLVQSKADLIQVRSDLTQARAELTKVHADLRVAQVEVETKAALVTELEGKNEALSKRMDELTNSIHSLETQIAETKRKLARAEGNRDFLTRELKRLQDEKATLVTQFNNLAALRAQIAKLKAEAAVNQRLTWMERGIYQRREMKGAEALMTPAPPPIPHSSRLNVEVERTGESRILPDTNSPPTTRQ